MTTPKTKPTRRAKAAPIEAPRQRAARRQAAAALGNDCPPAPTTEAESAAVAPIAFKTAQAPKGPAGKLGIVVALMQRPEGATVAQMGEATGWQPHSVRGALAGALKRKHKLIIIGEPGEAGRVYRIAAEQPA